jgi:hemerythrin
VSTTTAVPPLFSWKEEYSVGIESVDSQHKQLILMVSQLHRAMTQQKLREDFIAGRLTITIEAMNFLKTWLNDHILGMDQEFARFRKSAGK